MTLYNKKYSHFIQSIAEYYPKHNELCQSLHWENSFCYIGLYHSKEFNRYLFCNDYGQVQFVITGKEPVNKGNICVLFNYDKYIIFENIGNLTIKEFYRKISHG